MNDAAPQSPPPCSRRLVVDGPLTIYDACALKIRLQTALEQTDGDGLELDLSQVSEIDTAGLQLLLLAQRESRRRRRALRIVAASETVLEVIGFCHLADFFGEAPAPPAHAERRPEPGRAELPALSSS